MKREITLAGLISTPKMSKEKSAIIERQMSALLKKESGNSQPFRLCIGDSVEDFGKYKEGFAQPAGTVTELYRENGHNRVATEKGFFREQDLRKMA